MTLPVLDKFARGSQRFLVETSVRGWKFVDGLCAYRAQSDFSGGLGDMVFEVIHICKTGHSGLDQLQARDLSPEPHKVR